MPDLPERAPYFRANPHYVEYFKEVHEGGALDAKTKELIPWRWCWRCTASLEQ